MADGKKDIEDSSSISMHKILTICIDSYYHNEIGTLRELRLFL